jgi:hypothetical protein
MAKTAIKRSRPLSFNSFVMGLTNEGPLTREFVSLFKKRPPKHQLDTWRDVRRDLYRRAVSDDIFIGARLVWRKFKTDSRAN